MMRSEDLAPLLAPTPPPAGTIRGGTGTVVEWNPLDATNVIRYNGTDLVNLPSIASASESLAMQPDDEVVLHTFGTGGFAVIYIVGRIVRPGTPQAASFMALFGFQSAFEATQGTALSSFTSMGDLQSPANPGPAATVTIGQTGRALVIVQAEIVSSRGTVGFTGGQVGIALSGANTATASDQIGLMWLQYQNHTTASFESVMGSGSHFYTGLNTGSTTFTMKYGYGDAGCNTAMKNRTIMVLPF